MQDERSSAGDLDFMDAPTEPSPTRIAEAFREGQCPPDWTFDRFLPADLSARSREHWTPLATVMRVARWLRELDVRRVLDIGSGPGKFCVAAALASNCEFIGLEQDLRLIGVSRELARQFGLEHRARFLHGSVSDTVLPAADAYYLYNPFLENLLGPGGPASEVESRCRQFVLDVRCVEDRLGFAPPGTLVITYNGFGGRMPASYELLQVAWELPCILQLWRKDSRGADGEASFADAAAGETTCGVPSAHPSVNRA